MIRIRLTHSSLCELGLGESQEFVQTLQCHHHQKKLIDLAMLAVSSLRLWNNNNVSLFFIHCRCPTGHMESPDVVSLHICHNFKGDLIILCLQEKTSTATDSCLIFPCLKCINAHQNCQYVNIYIYIYKNIIFLKRLKEKTPHLKTLLSSYKSPLKRGNKKCWTVSIISRDSLGAHEVQIKLRTAIFLLPPLHS